MMIRRKTDTLPLLCCLYMTRDKSASLVILFHISLRLIRYLLSLTTTFITLVVRPRNGSITSIMMLMCDVLAPRAHDETAIANGERDVVSSSEGDIQYLIGRGCDHATFSSREREKDVMHICCLPLSLEISLISSPWSYETFTQQLAVSCCKSTKHKVGCRLKYVTQNQYELFSQSTITSSK